jgi:hypothetical protein
MISVKFCDFSFLVRLKRFLVIPKTVPVKLKGTSIINFMTGVPLIIIGIPLNLNGRNLKELQLKKKVMVKLLEFPWFNCSCDLKKFH